MAGADSMTRRSGWRRGQKKFYPHVTTRHVQRQLKGRSGPLARGGRISESVRTPGQTGGLSGLTDGPGVRRSGAVPGPFGNCWGWAVLVASELVEAAYLDVLGSVTVISFSAWFGGPYAVGEQRRGTVTVGRRLLGTRLDDSTLVGFEFEPGPGAFTGPGEGVRAGPGGSKGPSSLRVGGPRKAGLGERLKEIQAGRVG